MTDAAPRRSLLVTVIIGLGIAVVVAGIALVFFGVGAQLTKPRVITFTVQAEQLRPQVAEQIKVGDELYTDFAGSPIGRVTKVVLTPDLKAVPDAQGSLHAAPDPVRDRVAVTIEGTGREANGIVALSSQILQVGMFFTMVSNRYLVRGQVVAIGVR
jgi:hypothetical protein